MLCRNCRGENIPSSALVMHHDHHNLLRGVEWTQLLHFCFEVVGTKWIYFLDCCSPRIIIVAILCQIGIREFFVHLLI